MNFSHAILLEKWIKQCKLGRIKQVAILLTKPLFLKNYKIEERPTNRQHLRINSFRRRLKTSKLNGTGQKGGGLNPIDDIDTETHCHFEIWWMRRKPLESNIYSYRKDLPIVIRIWITYIWLCLSVGSLVSLLVGPSIGWNVWKFSKTIFTAQQHPQLQLKKQSKL